MTKTQSAGQAPTARDVLLVEDDLALSGYLASALRDEGFTVQAAVNREQVLKICAVSPPRLVLLDLGLPPHASTMDEGLAVLDHYIQQAPDSKIIVLTGQEDEAAALEAVRRGAFDFLVKPAPMAAVFSALRRAELFLKQESRLSQAGEARLHISARLGEGPKEAGANAEEQLVRRVLAASGYNVAETARRLGLAREHVYYYLKKYGIQRPE